MPMPFNKIEAFEKINNVQVNIFQYEQKNLVPLKVSQRKDVNLIMDLLLLSDGSAYHYVLILDLKNLINHVKGLEYRADSKVCRNCFHMCFSPDAYQRHVSYCYTNEPAAIKMPSIEKCKLHFKNCQARWFAPIVIYFDLESVIKPTSTCSNNPSSSSTEVIEVHEPCGYCLVVVEHGSSTYKHFSIDRSPVCMQNFAREIEMLAKDIYGYKQTFRYVQPTDANDDSATNCWLLDLRHII